MSLHRRLVPFAALSVSVDLMATKDTSGSGESGDGGPEQPTESADISARLQELARQLGINQAALARLLGISRQTFNPYFTGTRGAGLPTIRKAAQRSGRTVSWFLGEDAGRAVIGTADAMGRVTMTTQTMSPGIVAFPVASGPFPAGSQAFVDPCTVFLEGKYLLVTSKGEPEPWLAFARERGGLKLLDRMTTSSP